jgi:hypothetical protein
MRQVGIVEGVFRTLSLGTIRREDGGDLLFRLDELKGDGRPIQPGARVEFGTVTIPCGREYATDMVVL